MQNYKDLPKNYRLVIHHGKKQSDIGVNYTIQMKKYFLFIPYWKNVDGWWNESIDPKHVSFAYTKMIETATENGRPKQK
jgi:hypothetical protein